jgi:7-cyano-7-deazaguanine reductase
MEEQERAVLGKQVSVTVDELDLIPYLCTGEPEVRLTLERIMTRCPVTGQPDYAEIVILYKPAGVIVETKSLKLWLQRFIGQREFNEQLIATICDQFFQQVSPLELRVAGKFAARGGIAVEATVTRADWSTTKGGA